MSVNAALITRMANEGLSEKAILTRLALGVWANPDGCSSPSYAVLGQLTGQSVRSVGRRVEELEGLGYLERRDTRGHGIIEWRLVAFDEAPPGNPKGEEPEFTRTPAPPARPAAAGRNGRPEQTLFGESLPLERGQEQRVVLEIQVRPVDGAGARQGA